MTESAKPLRIFISYAHPDVAAVRKLHRYLRDKGFDVWFDKDSLLPGQDWQLEIEKGLNTSDVVLICLSQTAVSAEGFVQREFKFALDRTLDMPDGRIFLIPVRLQVCDVPTRLSRYHWVDLFEREGYQRLLRSLKLRAEQLARASVDESQPINIPDPDTGFGASLSVGQDVSGNVIFGNNNVINITPTPNAQDEAAKREKQAVEDALQAHEKAAAEEKLKEQERLAAEESENKLLAKIRAENERIAKEKAEQERLRKIVDAREQAEQERLARQKADAKHLADEQTEREQLEKLKAKKRPAKMLALIFGGLLLGAACLVSLFILWQLLSPKGIITSTRIVADTDKMTEVTSFTPNQTFYVVVTLANATDTTKTKAIWYSVNNAGTGDKLAEKEIIGSGSPITFNVTNNAGPWMIGDYRVELYVNNKLDKTLNFKVSSPPSSMPTDSASPIPTLAAGATQISPVDGMVLHYVPAGSFTMGSDDSVSAAAEDEKPAHQVKLDAFWIDETEVTNALYSKCVTAGKCREPANRDHFLNGGYAKHPVTDVSWDDATTYCSWAGRALPSEAQWEKAARGTDGRIYPWGNDAPSSALLNYNEEIQETTEAGHYPDGKSPYGAYDMAGNVWEWVNDWYDSHYDVNSPSTNPMGPDSGVYRVLRGGSWNNVNANVRVSDRTSQVSDVRTYDFGFRCALSP